MSEFSNISYDVTVCSLAPDSAMMPYYQTAHDDTFVKASFNFLYLLLRTQTL